MKIKKGTQCPVIKGYSIVMSKCGVLDGFNIRQGGININYTDTGTQMACYSPLRTTIVSLSCDLYRI